MADKCNPRESVSPRQFIYEGTAKERNAQTALREKNLKDSRKLFDLEQRQFEKTLSEPVLGFTERQHQVMYCDFAIFIAGVDVSPWVVGSLSISLSSRDGQNTASFTLQNANDNFVLTLRNLTDPHNKAGGWRDCDPLHLGSQYSERAKYQIFQSKNKEFDDCFFPNNPYDRYIGIFREQGCGIPTNLNRNANDVPGNAPLPPGSPPASSGFVRSARQWPLDPHRPVFHKHDPVRIFVHNPTTEKDRWLPGFTGFISSYSFNDDYVTGESQITINCYDIRGVMEKMRVAKNIRSSVGNVNALVELVDGSMNTGFFKDLLVESAWTSFVAGKSLFSVAQFLITGKGFSDPTGQEGTVLTPQFRTDMSQEDENRFKATGSGFVQPLTLGSVKGKAVFTRQNDASGVGTFRMGLQRSLDQRVQCDSNGFQKPDPTLEEWYNILLLGVRRSPTTGYIVGRDGLPINQPDLKSCQIDANVVNQAIAEGNLIAGFNDLAYNPGDLPPPSEGMLVRNAVQLIELTPEQEKEFNASTEGAKINNDIINLQKRMLEFDDQLAKDKARLTQLQNQAPHVPIPISNSAPGSFSARSSGISDEEKRRTEITDLLYKISNAPALRLQFFQADDQRLREKLNLAKAKFKRDHPSQDPKSSTVGAIQTSQTDKTAVPRTVAFTRAEVDAIGRATTWKGSWSPWNGLLHYLESGEGNIRSLLDISYQEQFDNSDIDWESRSSILSELCQKLDYQWWVTPIGDIVFEFPMYDFFPTAFGSFAPLMTFDHHLKSADFTDESDSFPTVFIGQGSYSTFAKYQEGAGQNNNEWANRVILFAPTLASRVGVVVEKETFPSFVGDTPLQPLTQNSPKVNNIPTSQEIADYLDRIRLSLKEPVWIQEIRDHIKYVQAGPTGFDQDDIFFWQDTLYKIDKIEGNYSAAANRAGQGTTANSLKGRQLILAQSVADNSGGLPGRMSQGDANKNIAETVSSIIKSMATVMRGMKTDATGRVIDPGERAYSDDELKQFQDYLIRAYSIPTDFSKASASTDNITTKNAQVERREHIRNWSILDFQRRLANAATFDQQNEYRPFLLPNKPVYCMPRQRIGMSTSVSHTMEINHICGTSLGVTNMKHLTVLQDGSLDFTHIAGAKNAPVDYSKLLFSKTNGIVPVDEAFAPIASTPESASILQAPTATEMAEKASSVAGHTQPTAGEEAMGESSIANRFKQPDPALDQKISSGTAGIVTFAGYFDDINGLTVMVDAGDGTRVIIPNLNKLLIDAGSKVAVNTVVGTRPPGVVSESIIMDCGGKSKAVPSSVDGILTSSTARNPPPARSTLAQSASNSFVRKADSPPVEIRQTPQQVSSEPQVPPPVSEEIMSSSVPVSSSKG